MSGGWIKFEKDLRTDPRFLRMCKAYVTQVRITPGQAATQLVGALVILWCYADTHIREDDTLDLGADEIDELVSIQGFAALMPTDWLEILDTHRVKLPSFQEHNGTDAKKRALTQKRVARHRVRNVTQERSNHSSSSNVVALPDQTRLDQTRLDQTRLDNTLRAREQDESEMMDAFAVVKATYPRRTGDQSVWLLGERSWRDRIADGVPPAELLAGVERYARYVAAGGVSGPSMVMGPQKFFDRIAKNWQQPWDPPPTRADKRLAGNISAAEEFMRRTETPQ